MAGIRKEKRKIQKAMGLSRKFLLGQWSKRGGATTLRIAKWRRQRDIARASRKHNRK